MKNCPSDETLRQLILGGRPGDEPADLEQHLRNCQRCRSVLDQVSDDTDLLIWRGSLSTETPRLDHQQCSALIERILRDSPSALTFVGEGSTDRRGDPDPAIGLLAGQQLGRFELLEVVGRGGMGVVYKALDIELDRVVALKVVPFSEADLKARIRFVREAQAAAKVKHDHVVTIHAVESASDGSPCLVMEFVRGRTYQQLIQGGPIPHRTAAEILSQAARGLQAIHDAGIVHCDVKPSNIMLEDPERRPHDAACDTAEGGGHATHQTGLSPIVWRAKITDFGLARAAAAERRMTLEFAIGGTPHYMSPEQLRDQPIGVTTDIYSLGVTLYESLTGAVPFTGTPQVVMRQIEHVEPRRPRTLNPDVPQDLEVICLKAIEKDAHRRYPTAAAFGEDLQRWLRGEPILARPVGNIERGWRWCRRNPRIAGLSAAVASLLLFATVGSASAAFLIAVEQGRTKREHNAARLAESEAREYAKAAEQARGLAETHALRSREQRDLALEAHVQLVGGVHDRLADTPGTLALRRDLLEAAAVGLAKIIESSTETDDADHPLFLAHQRLGEAYLTLGKSDDARRQLERAREMAQKRFDADPNGEMSADDLAAALTSLAEFHAKSLDFKTAREELTQALALLDGIEKKAPGRTDTVYRQIRVLSNLGDTALRLNEMPVAEEHFARALTLSEQLRTTDQSSPQSRRVFESILRRLGDAALLRGRMGQGVDFYRRALRSAEESGLAGISLLERHGLVDAYGRLGLVLVWLGESEEAETCFQKAIALNHQAAQIEPENVALVRKSAIFQQRLGDVDWSRGDYAAMREHLLKALDVHRSVAAKDPTSTLSQNDLVICLEQLGRLEARVEKFDDARRWYRELLDRLATRKKAGTLTDPISLSFEQSTTLILEVLEHLPAALESDEAVEDLRPPVAVAVILERAIHRARQRDVRRAQATLEQLDAWTGKLAPLEVAAMQLAIARANALCCEAISTEPTPQESASSSEDRRREFQVRGIDALEKYVAAEPFNATYLGFEFELRALRDHPRFQKLADRFRNPQL